jgi:hypothetical protein
METLIVSVFSVFCFSLLLILLDTTGVVGGVGSDATFFVDLIT